MVRVQPERLGHTLFQLGLNRFGCFAFGEAGAITKPEDMGVDRECFLLEPAIENDIGGLAAHTGQSHERVAVIRHFAAIMINQPLGE